MYSWSRQQIVFCGAFQAPQWRMSGGLIQIPSQEGTYTQQIDIGHAPLWAFFWESDIPLYLAKWQQIFDKRQLQIERDSIR